MSGCGSWWGWIVALALLPALTACGSSSGPESISLSSPPSKPAAGNPVNATPRPAAGFTPLPTPQQVISEVGVGRVDPFAPLPPSSGEAPPVLPEGLKFSGVILASGHAQALVQFQGNAGSLVVGDQGGRTTDLLPQAWKVAAVDVAQGRLTLATGPEPSSPKITLEL
ncbi:hypothetical protein KUL97_03195 [Synechococcus sp. HK05]|uniref:hypothetical protein n=1 Tax=Synechococcus sp. HK05 TaxID=2725975 RepID=UPI001C38D3C3|nr:hypothetical protein [Synechococcus sp. HK05]MBV2350711.1 hypothetical protein [Synechococcus sp. HK05]